MSIVSTFWSDLFVKKVGFSQSVSVASAAFSKWLGQEGVSSQAVSQGLSDVKQGISNVIALVDSNAAPMLQDATLAVETAANGLTSALLGRAGPIGAGVAAALNPAEDAAIAQAFQVLHAVLTHAEASARSGLNLPAPTTITNNPQTASVSVSGAGAASVNAPASPQPQASPSAPAAQAG